MRLRSGAREAVTLSCCRGKHLWLAGSHVRERVFTRKEYPYRGVSTPASLFGMDEMSSLPSMVDPLHLEGLLDEGESSQLAQSLSSIAASKARGVHEKCLRLGMPVLLLPRGCAELGTLERDGVSTGAGESNAEDTLGRPEFTGRIVSCSSAYD
jgi:hypothetical protein